MRRLVSLMMLLLGSAQAQDNPCRLSRVATLPFRVVDHHLLVDITVNGQPAHMLFDTGADTTVITESAASRLDLRPVAPEHGMGFRGSVQGVGGSARIRPMAARSIDIGGLRARDFGVLVVDSGQNALEDGLLSSDLLAKYDIDLDFWSNRIRLYYPVADCTRPAAYMQGPLFMARLNASGPDQGPRVPVTIGGQDFVAALDTGASGTMLFRRATDRLGLAARAALGERAVTVAGIAGRPVQGRVQTLASLGIGDLELANMPVFVSRDPAPDDVDMVVGLDFLSRVHAWISYSSHTLIMQFPPRPSPG